VIIYYTIVFSEASALSITDRAETVAFSLNLHEDYCNNLWDKIISLQTYLWF